MLNDKSRKLRRQRYVRRTERNLDEKVPFEFDCGFQSILFLTADSRNHFKAFSIVLEWQRTF